jgi:hypothetical protein
MNSIRQQFSSPLIVGVIGLILGIIFGLVVLGWWLWPVKWINANPEHLSAAAKEEYLRMSVEAYGQNGDIQKARDRYNALGDDAEDVLAQVANNPDDLDSALILNFNDAVAMAAPIELATPEAEAEAGEVEKPSNILAWLLPVVCVLLLGLIAVAVYVFIVRGRMLNRSMAPTPTMEAEEISRQVQYTEYDEGAEPPIAQFMASYKIGDDLFDDSFSIDSPSGEFLGECGIGISETIGVGDHKKVTAFEVWLFDKNDIQTVTKVLMSSHAFQDKSISQRLEAKGEPVLAEPGVETSLETQTLQLVARVIDMSYGDGNMPSQSYFNHLILELSVWIM